MALLAREKCENARNRTHFDQELMGTATPTKADNSEPLELEKLGLGRALILAKRADLII